jgi:opacity protein-like surface antigen
MTGSNRFRLACALALAILLAGTPAQADVYIGAGAYKSEAQVSGLDDDDTTTGVQLGYVIIDSVVILSAELGKYDLGSYSDGGVDVDADALTLAGVLSLAIGPFFEIYAKAGIASADVEVNGKSEDGDETFSGIGFSFDILDTVDVYVERLEFDTEVDSELLGAGVRLQF